MFYTIVWYSMVSYCTDFLCTYQLIEDADDSDNLFRVQFLQAFNADSKDSLDTIFNTINITTNVLYDLYKKNEQIQNLLHTIKLSNNTMSTFAGDEENEFLNFQFCFSYSYFYVTHKILCSLINNTRDE